jgi:ATP-binding protein involved in chromosome partitioning
MVTTPQDVALLDVRKALGMFQRLNVPILGIVENMSGFTCGHCGQHTAIFGDAGGNRISQEYGVPLLVRIPLEPETRIAGDEGMPITLRRPDSGPARAFAELARAVERRLEELGPLSSLPTIR